MEPPQPATQPVAPNPVQSDRRQRARDAEAMAAALAGASAVKKLTLSQNSQQQTADRARMREEAEAHTSAQLLVCPMCMKVYVGFRCSPSCQFMLMGTATETHLLQRASPRCPATLRLATPPAPPPSQAINSGGDQLMGQGHDTHLQNISHAFEFQLLKQSSWEGFFF